MRTERPCPAPNVAPTPIGVAAGLLAAFGIAGVALLLALIAVVASYWPARRATNVDPIIALRNE